MQESDNTENIIDKIFLILREKDSIFQHLSRDLIKQIFIDMFPLDSTKLNDFHLIEKIIRDMFKTNVYSDSDTKPCDYDDSVTYETNISDPKVVNINSSANNDLTFVNNNTSQDSTNIDQPNKNNITNENSDEENKNCNIEIDIKKKNQRNNEVYQQYNNNNVILQEMQDSYNKENQIIYNLKQKIKKIKEKEINNNDEEIGDLLPSKNTVINKEQEINKDKINEEDDIYRDSEINEDKINKDDEIYRDPEINKDKINEEDDEITDKKIKKKKFNLQEKISEIRDKFNIIDRAELNYYKKPYFSNRNSYIVPEKNSESQDKTNLNHMELKKKNT